MSGARRSGRALVGTVVAVVLLVALGAAAVVAGGADEVVPVEHSRAVATAAGASYVEVPGARHNDPALGSGPELVAAVVGVAGHAAP